MKTGPIITAFLDHPLRDELGATDYYDIRLTTSATKRQAVSAEP